MRFYCDMNNNIYEGTAYMTDDTSIIFKYVKGVDWSLDYTVSLGDSSRFLIDLAHKTGKCGPMRCFMNSVKVISKELEIPKSKRGELYFVNDNEMERYGGTTYMPFEDTCYYDKINDVLCIGNPYREGETVEFAANTYAVVDHGDLAAIFIKVSHLKEHITIGKRGILSVKDK